MRVPRWPTDIALCGGNTGVRAGSLFGDAKVDKLAQHVAAFQFDVTFVDLLEFDMARDQMIELQFALLPRVQQLRHVEPEPVAAHRRALDLPLPQEIVAMQLDLHTERYHADDRRRAAGAQA